MAILDSLVREHMAFWPAYYAILQQELGATATLLDIGGQRAKPNAASWTGRKFNASGLSPVWTPSEALSAWDTPFDLTLESNWLGHAPILTFNGTDEEADTPDAAYWTRDDSGAAPLSIGGWFNVTADTNRKVILAKHDNSTQAEWILDFSDTETVRLLLRDESASVNTTRLADAATTTGVWHHIVVTYDGAGGATAGNTITIYQDGAVWASTATNDGSYVAMEDLTAVVGLGTRSDGANFYNGEMLGGPWSPWFVQAELTAAQIKNIYEGMRLGLGV